MRAVLRLWFVVLSLFVVGSSSAETISATPTTNPDKVTAYCSTAAGVQKCFSTGQAACDYRAADYSAQAPFTWITGQQSYPLGFCYANGAGRPYAGWGLGQQPVQACPSYIDAAYTGPPSPATCPTSYSCPSGQNWTLNGANCTRPDCVLPQTRKSDGTCGIVCPSAGSNAMLGGASAYGITGSSSTCVSGIVFGSCKLTCTSGVSSGGKASCTGCTFTGATDLTGDTAQPLNKAALEDSTVTPQECLAQGKGYVTLSGGTVCVNSVDSSQPVQTVTTGTKSTTGSGAGTAGTSETTTTCEGGNCTSVTTNKDGAGSVIGTETSTGTDPSAKPKEDDPETDCEKFPESAGCLELGTPPGDEPVGESSVGSNSITPVSVGSSGTCPGDVTLPKGQVFSWAPACNFAAKLRPILIALAWLSAAFIVLGFTGAKS